MPPFVRAASLRGFPELISALGAEPREILNRFDMSAGLIADEDAMVPLTDHDRMLDAAARELDCPDLGLRLAEGQDVTMLGPIALAISSATTAGEALAAASRFLFVHSPALRIELAPDPLGRAGVSAVTYVKDLRQSPYSVQGLELGLGLVYRIARSLIGDRHRLRSVHLPHPPRSAVTRYVEFFDTPAVRFGTGGAALCVQSQLLRETLVGADEVIQALAMEHLGTRFIDPNLELVARTRITIAELLRSGTPPHRRRRPTVVGPSAHAPATSGPQREHLHRADGRGAP